MYEYWFAVHFLRYNSFFSFFLDFQISLWSLLGWYIYSSLNLFSGCNSLVTQLPSCIKIFCYAVMTILDLIPLLDVLHPGRHLVLTVFGILAILIAVWWYIVVLICSLLMTCKVSIFPNPCLLFIYLLWWNVFSDICARAET